MTRDQFWDYVDKSAGADGCWPWLLSSDGTGYGQLRLDGEPRQYRAHRMAVELDGREIPNGMCVDHVCRNKRCVNPAHLRIVTRRINNIENSTSASAVRYNATHCPRGHVRSAENSYVRREGTRSCALCRKERANEYVANRSKRRSFKKWRELQALETIGSIGDYE